PRAPTATRAMARPAGTPPGWTRRAGLRPGWPRTPPEPAPVLPPSSAISTPTARKIRCACCARTAGSMPCPPMATPAPTASFSTAWPGAWTTCCSARRWRVGWRARRCGTAMRTSRPTTPILAATPAIVQPVPGAVPTTIRFWSGSTCSRGTGCRSGRAAPGPPRPRPSRRHGPVTGAAAGARYHSRMSKLPSFPDEGATLTLPGPAGALEVAVDPPDPDATPLPLVAIICHPLPTEGGTMHNKVVTMAARSLRELGATTVRFNFRGTGGSEGGFDEGEGELEDLRAVAAWVRAQRPGHALWLAGFSFGAYVSLR